MPEQRHISLADKAVHNRAIELCAEHVRKRARLADERIAEIRETMRSASAPDFPAYDRLLRDCEAYQRAFAGLVADIEAEKEKV